jgi:hypothetical protein
MHLAASVIGVKRPAIEGLQKQDKKKQLCFVDVRQR